MSSTRLRSSIWLHAVRRQSGSRACEPRENDGVFDYLAYHVGVAAGLSPVGDKRVLVVGCNRGREVSLFLERGARSVTGIDLLEDVGVEFSRFGVEYHRMSVEEMSFADDRFDVVFCVATMEHVARPDLGFAEIGRVVAPFGLAYVCSTPLWHSRQGHHKADIFDVDDYPWLHLRYSADELKRMCADGQIALTRDVDADPHIDYMLDVANMNQLPARAYVAAASALERMVVERNELELEDEAVLGLVDADSLRDLEVRGIDQVELRALTHHYVGWKDERPREAEPPPSRLGFRSAPRRILRRMRPR